jgi:two-component system capsular synthesis sensor histidine kinase RcsC
VSKPANNLPLPRVIVAEDHPVCLLVLEDQLKGIGGCEVVLCENGADALRALESGPAALLLTDLSLPGIEGLALARRIRTGKAGQVAPTCPSSPSRPPLDPRSDSHAWRRASAWC